MSNKEISITEFELEDCKGNLRTLQANWESVPAVPVAVMTTSRGNSPEAVKNCLEATAQVSDAFDDLLENSLTFFQSMGIAFQESDEKAAQSLSSQAIWV